MWWTNSQGDDDWRRAWGYDFKWTSDHLTKEELRPLMYTYDKLATDCLDILDKISPPPPRPPQTQEEPPSTGKPASSENVPSTEKPGLSAPPAPSPHRRDYYALLRDHHASDPTLDRLWTDLTTVPDWVSWPQIARGQAVFYRYAGPAVAGLTFQSLLGGMGGYRVVETLARTGGFGVRVARRRLLETFQHVLLVTRDLESLAPGRGEGWASSVRVRFLHASVRRRILQLAAAAAPTTADKEEEAAEEEPKGRQRQQKRYYDVSAHGVPVNDLDSIGTIAAFSATLIWVSFPRQGIFLTAAERADYVALWRYVAHLLVGAAVADPYFSSAARARATMESLMLAEIDPSPASRVLANNIIAALADAPPALASADFLRAEARWLNGPELSDALHVPDPGAWYACLVGAQCVFFMAVCYASRMVPAWDRRRIEGLKARLHRITVQLAGGGEATHEFKYVPDLDVNTARQEGRRPSVDVAGKVGVEGRQSRALVAVTGTVMIAAVAWLGLRYASGMFQKV